MSGSAVAETSGGWLTTGSTSVMETVASSVVPNVTFAGRVLKPIFTLSPSSSTLSRAAVNVNDRTVWPLWNVTLAGTPE